MSGLTESTKARRCVSLRRLDSRRAAPIWGPENQCFCVGFVPVSRPDWSRPLPRPIVIAEVMKLATLDEGCRLVAKHLPAEYRSKFAWRKLAALLRRAAQGKDEAAEVSANVARGLPGNFLARVRA
jgi:hypothetical protein